MFISLCYDWQIVIIWVIRVEVINAARRVFVPRRWDVRSCVETEQLGFKPPSCADIKVNIGTGVACFCLRDII